MAGLNDKVRDRMRSHGQSIKERMQGGGRTAPTFDLTGKNALIQPGGSIVGRLLPRWDVAQKFKLADGKWVENPEYQDDLIYFPALEHWWDDASGKPNRVWCLRTFDEAAGCPLCEASEDLSNSSNKDDRDVGKRIRARKSFLFNAVMGLSPKRGLTESGKPDIRVLAMGDTLFYKVYTIMTGGTDEESAAFARGDISNPREGYDIKIIRPKDQSERWDAQCAPQPSPLVSQAETAAWGDWMSHLIDLSAMVEKEIKEYDVVYEQYWGERPPTAGDRQPGDDGIAAAEPAPAGYGPGPSQPEPAPARAYEPRDPWATTDAGPRVAPSPGQAPFDPPPGARPSGRTAAGPPPPARRPSGRR